MIYESIFLVRETAFDYFSVQKNIEQTKLIQTVLKKDSLSGLELYDWVCFWSHALVIFLILSGLIPDLISTAGFLK